MFKIFKNRQLVWMIAITGSFAIYGLIILPIIGDPTDLNYFPALLTATFVLSFITAKLTDNNNRPLAIIA